MSSRTASRLPGSNRVIRRTKAKPQAVRGGEAAPHGFEPRFAASEAAVLPLDERASSARGGSRTRRISQVCQSPSPAPRAPRGPRSPTTPGKSRVHCQLC